jgi:DNA ligase-1
MAEYYCTLAKKYNPEKHDVLGWMCSEKLDGVRAIYCPERKGFFSRSNKPLNVPRDYLLYFRNVTIRLDGEFFIDRGRFQDVVSAVRKKAPTDEEFEGVKYVVFDSLTEGKFEARSLNAIAALRTVPREIAFVLKQYTVRDMEGMQEMYAAILKRGGEGLMIRNPEVGYEYKRTGNLLKWKDEIDGTATVTGFDPGKGKHEGRVGALVCVDDETQVCFRVGTGLSDAEREEWQKRFDWLPSFSTDLRSSPAPYRVAYRIRWRAMELTRDGIPRHPVYYGIYEGE